MNNIVVPALARVEGEGGLYIGVKDGKAIEVRLDIYEPPRFFEAFLVDRYYQEVPDITARICGICPVAYQMSSIIALEAALSISVNPEIYRLRRLFYCGEYIESHALHMFLLQGPDLLGVPSALELTESNPELVRTALRIKKAGNAILEAIGGRSVHPVNACVGGWYRWPNAPTLTAILPELEWALDAARETVLWSTNLPYPELDIDYEFVAIHHPDEYGLMQGEILSSSGSQISVDQFETRYLEEHVKHSNALHGYTAEGGHYLVGPLARLNLNHEQLAPQAKEILRDIKLELPIKNPYKSLVARGVELVHYIAEAIESIKAYKPDGEAHLPAELMAGEGCGMSEAPRGLLYHRYKIDEDGKVKFARITPPTAQNLPRIEDDLRTIAADLIEMDLDAATHAAEHLVRSYDPCISCATHFLKLRIEQQE